MVGRTSRHRVLIVLLPAAVFGIALVGCEDAKGPTEPSQTTGTPEFGPVPGWTPPPHGEFREARPGTRGTVASIRWSADGKWIGTTSLDGTITVFDAVQERPRPPTPLGKYTLGKPSYGGGWFLTDGRLLVDTLSEKLTVRKFETGKELLTLEQSEHSKDIAFMDGEGSRLFTLRAVPLPSEFNIWDLKTGKLDGALSPKEPTRIDRVLGMSPDGSEVYLTARLLNPADYAVGYPSKGVSALNVKSKELVLRAEVSSGTPHDLFYANGTLFHRNDSWELRTGKKSAGLPWRSPCCVDLKGRFLVEYEYVPESEPRYTLWDVAMKKKLGIIPKLDVTDVCFAFSPDGKYLAVGGRRLWAKIGRPITEARDVLGRITGSWHLDERVLMLYELPSLNRIRILAWPTKPDHPDEVPQPELE